MLNVEREKRVLRAEECMTTGREPRSTRRALSLASLLLLRVEQMPDKRLRPVATAVPGVSIWYDFVTPAEERYLVEVSSHSHSHSPWLESSRPIS